MFVNIHWASFTSKATDYVNYVTYVSK